MDMRDFINAVSVLTLRETQDGSSLYHGTSLGGLLDIVESDSLYYDDGWEGPYGPSFEIALGFARGASKTRAQHAPQPDDKFTAEDFPTDAAEAFISPENGSGGAVIEFNRSLLARKHKITPIASKTLSYERDEEEERIIGDAKWGYVKGVNQAISAIHVVSGRDVFERYLSFLQILGARQQYKHAIAFCRSKIVVELAQEKS